MKYYVKVLNERGGEWYWVSNVDKPADISAWIVGISCRRRDAITVECHELGRVVNELAYNAFPLQIEIVAA
jgi:hypothetical protein